MSDQGEPKAPLPQGTVDTGLAEKKGSPHCSALIVGPFTVTTLWSQSRLMASSLGTQAAVERKPRDASSTLLNFAIKKR